MNEFHESYNTNLTEVERLKIEITRLRRRNQQLEDKANYDSWITSPDRMGGCFTKQEIEYARVWR